MRKGEYISPQHWVLDESYLGDELFISLVEPCHVALCSEEDYQATPGMEHHLGGTHPLLHTITHTVQSVPCHLLISSDTGLVQVADFVILDAKTRLRKGAVATKDH